MSLVLEEEAELLTFTVTVGVAEAVVDLPDVQYVVHSSAKECIAVGRELDRSDATHMVSKHS